MPTPTYYLTELPAVVEDVTYLPVFVRIDSSTPPTNTDQPDSPDSPSTSQSEKIICPANEYISSSTAGLTTTSKCGTGFAGTMTWTCGKDGKWTNNKDSVCKKSSIIDGFPDNYIYYGGAAIFALLAILMI